MEGIFQEVEESMANKKAALNAFNQLMDMQITKDSVKNLPPKALSALFRLSHPRRQILLSFPLRFTGKPWQS